MKKEEAVQLSTDQEWSTALDVVRDLYQDGHLRVIFQPFGGIPRVTLDEDELPRYLRETKLEAGQFRQIFREEISLLLFPAISGMADSELLGEDTPFADLSEEDQQIVLERRRRLHDVLFTGRLRREYETKMSGASMVLAEVDIQIFGAADQPSGHSAKSPVAVVRIHGEVARRLPMPRGRGMALELSRVLWPQETESISLTCTRSDIEYLRKRLGDIAQELAALEKGEDAYEKAE
ncbi:MAG: hypothetical protein KAW89_04235 [Armatimonadetes bacterium]|nr:hypothetical protein [Armatimonadota bacterium]